MRSIGIIAGGGKFPVLVAREARAMGCRVVAVAFDGHADRIAPGDVDELVFVKLGQISKLIKFFVAKGVAEVVMAGRINKPKAMDFRPDLRTAKVIFGLKERGDDAILRAFTRELEKDGLRVIAPHELLPGLLAPEGVLSKRKPTDEEWRDVVLGYGVARRMGELDIGQCVVVKGGIVAAVEALEGTDEAVRRGMRHGGQGCVVVKVLKPGQEERADLPSVGRGTLEVMAEGEASCLAVQAGKSLFFDREAALEFANAHKIAVVGVTDEMVSKGQE